MTNHDWMTPREAARYLRVRDSRISQWIRNGMLPAANVGSRARPSYRLHRNDLDALLRSFEVPVSQPRRQNRSNTGRDVFPDLPDSQ